MHLVKTDWKGNKEIIPCTKEILEHISKGNGHFSSDRVLELLLQGKRIYTELLDSFELK